VIDAQNDPEGKSLLLNGQLNSFRCQNCGQVNRISMPVLYHDAEKELLIAFVPMEASAQRPDQPEEKIIGDLMNELTNNLPQDEFKAYMFNPKRALTMQGLIDQVMEAEGITKEMVESQKERVQLIETFLQAETEDELDSLIAAHDDDITMELFQTLSLMAQRLMQNGNQQVAGQLVMVQEKMLEHSSFGQEVAQQQAELQQAMQSVGEDVEELGVDATREDFVDLAIEYAGEDSKLRALSSLVRPALDDDFFNLLTTRIGKAPADERDTLQDVREKLRAFVQEVDEQMRVVVQQKAQFLQALLSHENPAEVIRANADMIDENFMTVLNANLQEAERRQDIESAAKLREIYQITVEFLQSQMSPELRFINQLMTTDDLEARAALINDHADEYGDELLEVAEAVEQMLASQGQQQAIKRLNSIRAQLEGAMS
jgi:hypothetical protein